jgi:hypothetical protein
MTTRSSARPTTRFEASLTASKSFADYRNAFDRLVVEGDKVTVVGRSSCSDLRLDGPALSSSPW